MTTWIFQANPEQFDIVGYLATAPATIRWLVRQHAADMRVGDQVFIWRAKGGGAAKLSGIVAESFIETLPQIQDDDQESSTFGWTEYRGSKRA